MTAPIAFVKSKYILMHVEELDDLDRSPLAFIPNKGNLFNKVKRLLYNSLQGIVEQACGCFSLDDYAGKMDEDKEEIYSFIREEISNL